MSGIYLHIPFCKTRCGYCDFHSSTALNHQKRMVDDLVLELCQQVSYLEGSDVSTIYFGGGTPSVLKVDELNRLLQTIRQQYHVTTDCEITLEANPDDLDATVLSALKQIGFNRLSLGIQSFFDDDLKQMNRRHQAKKAIDIVYEAVNNGFRNISIDLIYGLPGMTTERWKANLQQAFDLPVTHLSAYHLTYEKGTGFYKKLRDGDFEVTDEECSRQFFELLIDAAQKNGYEHYEISNFCKPGFYSRHNTSYWTGEKYLGAGPSAHSFNGTSRRWNIAHNLRYMQAIEQSMPYFETEQLTPDMQYNEYVMTALRTKWGVNESRLQAFGAEKRAYFIKQIQSFIKNEWVIYDQPIYKLSRSGIMVSDAIIAELFWV